MHKIQYINSCNQVTPASMNPASMKLKSRKKHIFLKEMIKNSIFDINNKSR